MSTSPGRPRGESHARQLLVEAARVLFARHPFEAVSTRALAGEAGVDAALIRYYFGSKAGLFEQMLRETLDPVLQRLRQHSAPHHADAASCRIPQNLEALMRSYYQIMIPNPGLPRLIQRVMQGDRNTESYRILERIFEDILRLSQEWIQQQLVATGHLRAGVNPALVRLSVVSLMAFPMLAPPMLLENSGIRLNPDEIEQLIVFNVDLLQRALLQPHTQSLTESLS